MERAIPRVVAAVRAWAAAVLAAAVITGACERATAPTADRGIDTMTGATPSSSVTEQTAATPAPASAPGASRVGQAASNAPRDMALTVTSPVRQGGSVVVDATTDPRAACAIAVTSNLPTIIPSGLGPKNADAAGSVSWSWSVGGDVTPGQWTVEVSCELPGGQLTSARRPLLIE